MSMNFKGNEFELIRYIKERTASDTPADSGETVGIGDDAAIFRGFGGFSTVSSDLLVEGVDFEISWADPYSIGTKTLEVSMSDIAAMGCSPSYSLLSLAVPETLWTGDFMPKFIDGYIDAANRSGIKLVGGDISRTEGPLVIDSTVIGKSDHKPIRRNGAGVGDSVYVTGQLGGASAGLELLISGADHTKDTERLMERQLRPRAQVEIGLTLGRSECVTAMIDLSDGLCGDLHHILEASGVGATIELSRLPIHPDIRGFVDRGELSAKMLKGPQAHISTDLLFALMGGEDFELLFTVPEHLEAQLLPCFNEGTMTRIGRINGEVGIAKAEIDGTCFKLPELSFTHF